MEKKKTGKEEEEEDEPGGAALPRKKSSRSTSTWRPACKCLYMYASKMCVCVCVHACVSVLCVSDLRIFFDPRPQILILKDVVCSQLRHVYAVPAQYINMYRSHHVTECRTRAAAHISMVKCKHKERRRKQPYS